MRKLLAAVAVLLFLAPAAMALSMTHDEPINIEAVNRAKTTITFGQGTTVTVNGQPVASGYQLKKGDKLKVTGGNATLDQVVDGKTITNTITDGQSLDVQSAGGQAQVELSGKNGVEIRDFAVDLSSLGLPPPPPSPEKNNNVVKIVSPSTP